MDKFPCELLENIFSYLNLDDRYPLRIVCKVWKFLIDNSNKKLKSLLISEIENSNCKFFFYHTDVNRLFIDDYKPFKKNQLFLDCEKTEILLLKCSSQILDNVERLVLDLTYIYSEIDHDKILKNFFKILPFFSRLEKLHIEKDKASFNEYERDCNSLHLKLNTVQVLSIVNFNFDYLTIEAPKLKKFNIDYLFGSVKLKDCNLIELLETKFNNIFYTINPTLKYIYCQESDHSFNKRFFDLFPKLEIYNAFNFDFLVNSRDIETSGKNIFYLQSYKVKNLDNYFDLKNSEENQDFKLIYKHDPNLFETCDRTPFLSDFVFDRLEYDSKKLKRNNLMKLVHLQSLFVTKMIDDEDKLINFIKEYNPHFINLHFQNCQLSQQFYNQLPDFVDYVNDLELSKKFTFHNFSDFNFDFILNLKFLLNLRTDQELSGEFVVKLFKKLKYLEHVFFVNIKRSCYLRPIYYEMHEMDKKTFKFELQYLNDNEEYESRYEFSELDEFEDFMALKNRNLMGLPYQILRDIFDHFNLEERVKYREVNKKWKYIIDELKEKNLVINEKDTYTNKGIKRWFIDEYEYYDDTQLFLPFN